MIQNLNDLNKLLSLFIENNDGIFSIGVLYQRLERNPLEGKFYNAGKTIEWALNEKLLEKDNEYYYCTKQGKEFLLKGEYRDSQLDWNLSKEQKRFLNKIFLQNNNIIDFIKKFEKNYKDIWTFDFRRYTKPLEYDLVRQTELVKESYYSDQSLKIIKWNQEYIRELLLIQSSNNLNLDTLEKRLEEQRICGERAEEIVCKNEKMLLKKSNQPHLSEEVIIISADDVARGYDIESFQSDKSSKKDKFIEVKGTNQKENQHKYFISKNEINKARELGVNYCLVLVSEVYGKYKIKYIPNPRDSEFKGIDCDKCGHFHYDNLEPVTYRRK